MAHSLWDIVVHCPLFPLGSVETGSDKWGEGSARFLLHDRLFPDLSLGKLSPSTSLRVCFALPHPSSTAWGPGEQPGSINSPWNCQIPPVC